MVEANADPAVVTAQILRETREAAAHDAALALTVACAPDGRSDSPEQAAEMAAAIPPPGAPATATETFASGGAVQFIAVAVLVAVLIVAWIVERRSRRKGEEIENGRGF